MLALFAALLGVLAAAPASAAPVHASTTVGPLSLPAGETAIQSDGHHYYGLSRWNSLTTHLQYQQDGNFVLYCNASGLVLWATNLYKGPWVSPPAFLVLQSTDGNLVIYGSGINWATGTNSPGDYLVVQNDGNVVIYKSTGGTGSGAIWATNTRHDLVRCPDEKGYDD